MHSKPHRRIALIIVVAVALLIPGVARLGHTDPPALPGAMNNQGPAADADQQAQLASGDPTGSATPVAATATSAATPSVATASVAAAFSETACPLCGPQRDLAPSEPPLRGADVGELQDRLERLGYYHGLRDSVYGSELTSAVRAFQRDYGLEDDGVVGDAVWNALDDQHETAFMTIGKPAGTPVIVINIDKRKLSLYFDQNLFATFPVAVGKSESPSPIGEWHIVDKDRNWGTGFGSRFMKLDIPWGAYGIHGTNKPWSIGQAMSGGCIRMHDRHVERLFELVKVGTKVRIIGTLHVRRLCRGDRGTDVMEAQAALAEAGCFSAKIDGFFGGDTEQAVLKFQREHGLVPNGQIDTATYNALGM